MPLPGAEETAFVPAPQMASATAVAGDPGVYQFTFGTTALIYEVPADWKGAWVRVRTSATIHMNFAVVGEAPSALVAANQASATTAGNGSVATPFTGLVPDDQTGEQIQSPGDDFWVPPNATYMSVIADAAGTECTIRRSGWPGSQGN